MSEQKPTYIDERVAHWADVKPEGEAMVYGERTWTWREWNDRVRRAAGGLSDLGIGRGDVVAFLDKNHPACVELSLAAGSLGAANAIVNWRSSGDEVEYAVNDCGARILVVGSELMPTVTGLGDRLPSVEKVIEVTPDGGEGDEYEAWLAASEPRGRSPETEPGDTCLVMFSSGTTGRPKGIMLSHTALIEHTLNAMDGLDLDDGDKVMVAMPLFHVGGSSYVLQPLHNGVPVVMTREADAKSLAWAILQGANRTFLVPAVLAQVLQAGPEAVKVFAALKSYAYGASPMPAPLLRAALEAWPDTDFLQVYGLTETSGVVTSLKPEAHRDPNHPERLTSAGTPIPGVEIRIVDPVTLEDKATGEHGEIWLRTPQVMNGFLGREEETRQVLTDDGWFRSGDLGRLDTDGYLYVEDRLKDMIISGGENIYSPEVERVLAEHPAVMEVAIIGVPDDQWGESVKAVVALKPDTQATEEELIEWCRRSLAHFKCPRSVDILDLLPRNPTGKILKRELRRPYWEGRSSAVV